MVCWVSSLWLSACFLGTGIFCPKFRSFILIWDIESSSQYFENWSSLNKCIESRKVNFLTVKSNGTSQGLLPKAGSVINSIDLPFCCYLYWIVVLEKTLESPLDYKEIQPVHPEGDQSWVFSGRTDVEAETPVLWPPHVKSWLIGKDPDAGRDWGQEEKGMTEDEMAGWHHRLDGHEFE